MAMEQEYFRTNVEFADKVSEETINLVLGEAKKAIESQENNYNRIIRTSSTLLGWVVAGIISLSGVIVVLAQTGFSVTLIMATYGFVSLLIPLWILARGLHYKQDLYTPGCPPNNLLSKDIVDWIVAYGDSGSQEVQFKIMYLQSLQRHWDKNNTWHINRVMNYRAAVKSIIVCAVVGTILFVCLMLF